MSSFDSTFQHTLAVQSWTLYGIGVSLIFIRLYARVHRVGWRNLMVDDWLMLAAGGFYTTLIVCLNVIATGGGSNLFLPEEFATFTQEDIEERIKGSKLVIVSEQAMLNVIYTLKACLLFLYYRLTIGTRQNLWVKIAGYYVATGWTATEIAFFTACRPFNGYWAVPPPDPQCTTLQHYAIIQACFNLSSDMMMLLIALPMVLSLKVPLKQKIVLAVVFSMGIFVIIAAILTKVYNLSNVYDTSYMIWYTREASVAVYVTNLPLIWPLMREWFPSLRNMTSTGKSYLPTYGQGRFSRRIDGQQMLHSSAGEEGNEHQLSDFKFASQEIMVSAASASSLEFAKSNGRQDNDSSKADNISATNEISIPPPTRKPVRSFSGTEKDIADVSDGFGRQDVENQGDKNCWPLPHSNRDSYLHT